MVCCDSHACLRPGLDLSDRMLTNSDFHTYTRGCRWSEAESKIPALEKLIHDANSKFAHDRLLNQEKANRHRRDMERLNALLLKEQEAKKEMENFAVAMARGSSQARKSV